MRLTRARVTKYRSIRDSGWFDVEQIKTILVGPNEAGKTALLQALQRLNAPNDIRGFDPLRDYPRSELNDIDVGKVDPEDVTVVEGHFSLDDEDEAAVTGIDASFKGCTYIFGRQLDNSSWHQIKGDRKFQPMVSLRRTCPVWRHTLPVNIVEAPKAPMNCQVMDWRG